MKICEYGLSFVPTFFKAEPFVRLQDCVSYIISCRATGTKDYKLGIKIVWNGKNIGKISLKVVEGIVYVKVPESLWRAEGLDDIFVDKLFNSLPAMQDCGKFLMGVMDV